MEGMLTLWENITVTSLAYVVDAAFLTPQWKHTPFQGLYTAPLL